MLNRVAAAHGCGNVPSQVAAEYLAFCVAN
jgi:hypothetical protein